MEPIRGGEYANPEDLEGARDSDGQTNRRMYERKETQHILNLLTPTTARAQTLCTTQRQHNVNTIIFERVFVFPFILMAR